MRSVSFVFANPGHHFALMAPVARALVARGVPAQLVSIAELRGLRTPDAAKAPPGVRLERAIPPLHTREGASGFGADGAGTAGGVRRVVQSAVWRGALGPRLAWLTRGAGVIVVPNDTAYPYDRVLAQARARGARTAVMQEGIRFELPKAFVAGKIYGTSGLFDRLCVWGEGSAAHFEELGVPRARVVVTGNPRFDDVSPPAWRERGAALMATLGLSAPPLAFLSNPIEIQGYGSTADKLALFEQFLVEAAPLLAARERTLLVKCHLNEDPETFRAVAARTPAAARVHVLGKGPSDPGLFEVLACAEAGVVLASTVGLEALHFGMALAVLEIPGHPLPFEYVSRGAAVALRAGAIGEDLAATLDGAADRRPAAAALVARHFAHVGRAADETAAALADLL
jgi:hypothetical protein